MLDEIEAAQKKQAARATGVAEPKTAHKEAHGNVAFGAEVDIREYVVPGAYTVFDFYSEFCGPCRKISPFLDKLDQSRSDLSVVRVDINRPGVRGIDWASPVARQYRLESVPHFKIFGPDGNLMAEGEQAYRQVIGWIQKLEG